VAVAGPFARYRFAVRPWLSSDVGRCHVLPVAD
jgi:hypothetical protein